MPYLQLYGITGVSSVMPLPVITNVAPTSSDTNYVIGQPWLNTATGFFYTFNGSNWSGAAGAGNFAAITVTTGPNVINGSTLINNNFNQSTGINTGTSTGSVTIKNSTGTGDVNIRVGSGAGNVHIADGTGTGSVTIGNIGNGGVVNIASNTGLILTSNGAVALNSATAVDIGLNVLSDISIGAVLGAKDIILGNDDGLTNIEMNAFKATANAAASANAAFTANSGTVACIISNLNTAPGAPGTITVTNTVIDVGSCVVVNFSIAGAEDATVTIKKIRITADTATISYTNEGAADIDSDVYMSLMVIS